MSRRQSVLRLTTKDHQALDIQREIRIAERRLAQIEAERVQRLRLVEVQTRLAAK